MKKGWRRERISHLEREAENAKATRRIRVAFEPSGASENKERVAPPVINESARLDVIEYQDRLAPDLREVLSS